LGYEQLTQVIQTARRQGKTPDLHGIDLASSSLVGLDLAGVDLSEANLSKADLTNARLGGTILTGADLSYANLKNADLSETRLDGANLSHANLINANLAYSTLQGANLTATNLTGADLTDVDLQEAYLRHANLSDGGPKNLWRGFFQHLGPYVMVISALAMINLITSTDTLWFLFPAIVWGAGLGIHFWHTVLNSTAGTMNRRWHGFLEHLGPYLAVISALAMINLITSTDTLWFLFPAAIWGVGLGIHFWSVLLNSGREEEVSKEGEVRKGMAQARRQARRHARRESQHVERPAETHRPPEVVGTPLVSGSDQINSKTIQVHLDKAQAYKEQIHNLIQATPGEAANAHLRNLVTQVDEWVQAIEDLAIRVDNFQQNRLIHHDLDSVPEYIADLENRLQAETNPSTRAELERTLNNRRSQLASLQQLENTMKRAEIQIESTLSALGTIYSQILTGQSTHHVADYSRLSEDVDEEVQSLQDQLEALEEVKLGRL